MRPVHFAHAPRNDPALVPFLRKGQMEQWEVYVLLGNSQDTGLLNGAEQVCISLEDFL